MYVISKALYTLSEKELDELINQGNVNIGWWNSLDISKSQVLSQYADGFYNVTCDLLDKFVEKRVYSDADALPIFYLIFHFIELALKASIEARLEWFRITGKPAPASKQNHKIVDLLQFLASLFEPDEEFLSNETQAFIRKMANLNGRSAQAFRYPFEKGSGKNYWEDRPVFSVGILKAEFAIHGAELYGFQSWLCYHYKEGEYAEDDHNESYE